MRIINWHNHNIFGKTYAMNYICTLVMLFTYDFFHTCSQLNSPTCSTRCVQCGLERPLKSARKFDKGQPLWFATRGYLENAHNWCCLWLGNSISTVIVSPIRPRLLFGVNSSSNSSSSRPKPSHSWGSEFSSKKKVLDKAELLMWITRNDDVAKLGLPIHATRL